VRCKTGTEPHHIVAKSIAGTHAPVFDKYYIRCLNRTNLTNYFHTIHQHLATPTSLKMVSVTTSKEETNVFPNGHPLQFHLCYPGS
jgi:hypothetical protein